MNNMLYRRYINYCILLICIYSCDFIPKKDNTFFMNFNNIIVDGIIKTTNYDSLTKTYGYPNNFYKLPIKCYPFENNVYDTIVIMQYQRGITYFKYRDTIQLMSVDFKKNPNVKIYNKDICFNQNLQLNSFCKKYDIDNEYISKIDKESVPYSSKTGSYFIQVFDNNSLYGTSILYFDENKKLRYIDFGYYNSGILMFNKNKNG